MSSVQAMSPDGEAIVTGAGDETLRFWNVFSKMRSTKVFILSIFFIVYIYYLPVIFTINRLVYKIPEKEWKMSITVQNPWDYIFNNGSKCTRLESDLND